MAYFDKIYQERIAKIGKFFHVKIRFDVIKSWETVEKHAMETFYHCFTFLREVLYSSYVQIISLNEQGLPSKVFKLDNTNSILDIMCREDTLGFALGNLVSIY